MELPFQKFNGLNFHTWQLKTQMRLMHEGLWDIVRPLAQGEAAGNGNEAKAKAIIGLALSDSYIHFIDLGKTPREIWKHLSDCFSNSDKISLKSQLYSLKMQDKASLSSHINYLMSLRSQIEKENVKDKLSDGDFRAIMLKSLSPKFNNVVFTLSQLTAGSPAELLDKTIAALNTLTPRENTTLKELLDLTMETLSKFTPVTPAAELLGKTIAELKKLAFNNAKELLERTMETLGKFIPENPAAVTPAAELLEKTIAALNELTRTTTPTTTAQELLKQTIETLSKLTAAELEKTIATLLAEEKRMNT